MDPLNTSSPFAKLLILAICIFTINIHFPPTTATTHTNMYKYNSTTIYPTASAPFTNGEVEIIRSYFESNINYNSGASGCVIASPSSENPNYLYHWQRDAAISMHTLQYTAPNTSTFEKRFENYVTWVTNAQSLSDPNSIDILGEPKFNIDGSVYTGAWCRPQNDGPASRATALTTFALYNLDNDNTDYVTQYLFNTDGTGAIPTDLNYVMQHWDDTNNCDLWEEQEGIHWYTLMVQRNALLYGATLATQSGIDRSDLASSWNNTAASMIDTIKSFETDDGIISEGSDRPLDCSIIVGTLYGGFYDLYGPTDTTVLNTMSAIQDFWYDVIPTNSDGVPGVIIGRYEDDVYTGCSSQGGSTAHGWILCTNAMGDVYYRNAKFLANIVRNKVNPDAYIDEEKLHVYGKILKRNFPEYSNILVNKYAKQWDKKGVLSIEQKYDVLWELGRYMTTTGDDQLTRVHYHVAGCNYHMSEQLCETNGYEIGAWDLTWAYGTFLSAWYYRGQAVDGDGYGYGHQMHMEPMEREMDVDWDRIYKKIELEKLDDNFCAGCSDQCGD